MHLPGQHYPGSLTGSQTSLVHNGSGFSVTASVSVHGRRVALWKEQGLWNQRDLHFKHSSATHQLKDLSTLFNLFQTQSPHMKYGDNTDFTKPCVWHIEGT